MPIVVKARSKITTENGRRRQLFSPVPEMNGTANSRPIAATGPVSIRKVSVHGGSNANNENSHRKKKSGRGTVWMIVGIGLAVGADRTLDRGDYEQRQDDQSGEDQVLLRRERHERLAVLADQFLILLQVGIASDYSTGHRPFVDSQPQHQEQMQADEGDQQRRESRRRAA